MKPLARTDTSMLGTWLWTVDGKAMVALAALIILGFIMVLAASPPVADRLGLSSFHFVLRQSLMLPLAIAIIGGVSLLEPHVIRRVAAVGFVAGLVLLVVILAVGTETNGAKRWISILGFSLQPSELVKPCLAVVTAWMLAQWRRVPGFPGAQISVGLVGLVAALLMMQPDLGQTLVVLAVWFGQLFIAGLPLALTVFGVVGACAVVVGAYFTLDHVTARVDRFLDPGTGDNFQVERSIEAISTGGLFGTGPGDGEVKNVLPDAHTDFVFAVMNEEFGALVGFVMIGLVAFLVVRGFMRLRASSDLFVILAGAGLLAQFGVQSLIHMASALQLIPAKGMTLPFVSYGGSSLISMALCMGMVLTFTRSTMHREVKA
ncbi:MAG: putative peptidoglycan glycosyltransferase FtsW [Alphaproteobacteria bacterium]|nr:putative peptidoglycan glycosyltransferase FtsW [Alphaproteobacteria bacterium]